MTIFSFLPFGFSLWSHIICLLVYKKILFENRHYAIMFFSITRFKSNICSFLDLDLFFFFFHFSIQIPTCSNFQGSTDSDSIDNQALVFSKKNNLDPLCKNYPRRRLLFKNVIIGLDFSEMLHFIYTLYKSLTQDNTLLIFGCR